MTELLRRRWAATWCSKGVLSFSYFWSDLFLFLLVFWFLFMLLLCILDFFHFLERASPQWLMILLRRIACVILPDNTIFIIQVPRDFYNRDVLLPNRLHLLIFSLFTFWAFYFFTSLDWYLKWGSVSLHAFNLDHFCMISRSALDKGFLQILWLTCLSIFLATMWVSIIDNSVCRLQFDRESPWRCPFLALWSGREIAIVWGCLSLAPNLFDLFEFCVTQSKDSCKFLFLASFGRTILKMTQTFKFDIDFEAGIFWWLVLLADFKSIISMRVG